MRASRPDPLGVVAAPDDSGISLDEATYRGDYIRLEMDLKP